MARIHLKSGLLIVLLTLVACAGNESPSNSSQTKSPVVARDPSVESQLQPNTCIIENSGETSFPVKFPVTVSLEKHRVKDGFGNYIHIPVFNSQNTPLWPTWGLPSSVLGPGTDPSVYIGKTWQWVARRLDNSLVFTKWYLSKDFFTAYEGLQMEFVKFNERTEFTDRETGLVFRCLIGQ